MSPVPESGEPDPPPGRGPVNASDAAPSKQRELKLNVGIGVIGTILSVAVALIFFLILDEIELGIVFAVVAVVSAAVTAYAFLRRRRGQQRQEASQR